MNVFLAYLLDEYETAGRKADEYRSAHLRYTHDGYEHLAKRVSTFENVQRIRRSAFYDTIRNFLDLTGELDPDDVAAAEKSIADF